MNPHRARLAYVGVCWRTLAYVGVCWRMLAYVGVCWRMLAYVGVQPLPSVDRPNARAYGGERAARLREAERRDAAASDAAEEAQRGAIAFHVCVVGT